MRDGLTWPSGTAFEYDPTQGPQAQPSRQQPSRQDRASCLITSQVVCQLMHVAYMDSTDGQEDRQSSLSVLTGETQTQTLTQTQDSDSDSGLGSDSESERFVTQQPGFIRTSSFVRLLHVYMHAYIAYFCIRYFSYQNTVNRAKCLQK